jgi:hypothetical protein
MWKKAVMAGRDVGLLLRHVQKVPRKSTLDLPEYKAGVSIGVSIPKRRSTQMMVI